MIHSYPHEYYELYNDFKNGGTIRTWINAVEKLGRRILEHDPNINLMKFQEKFQDVKADDWVIKIVEENVEIQGGAKNSKASHIVYSIGAHKIGDQLWVVSMERLIDYINSDTLNKFKGDMLEVLAEIFFNVFHADEAVGIRDYEPVLIGEDFGVDAIGINVNGHKVVVQVKYRFNPEDKISYSDIARTFTSAVKQFHIMDVVNYDNTIYLFTTSGGVSSAYQKVMGKSVVIDRSIISTKIDNNLNFWKNAFDMIIEAME